MAWNRNKPSNRKTWPFRRRRFTKKISVKALPKSVARKRSDWVWLYNDTGSFDSGSSQGCTIRCVEFGASYCEEPSTRVPIMPEGAVAALYDDDITIAQMRGFINMRPRWLNPSACEANTRLDILRGMSWPIYLKAGLYKQELVSGAAGVPPFVDPNIGDDWTDVRALRKWQHIWQPRGRQAFTWRLQDDFIGVCSDVTKTSVNVPGWTLGSGSGTWAGYTEPAIQTDCDPWTVNDAVESCVLSQFHAETDEPAWYRMPLFRRSPIRLHENDSLDIFMNWSIPRPDATCVAACEAALDGTNPCAMQFSIQLAVKLEYG